jgi:hypothetical protein
VTVWMEPSFVSVEVTKSSIVNEFYRKSPCENDEQGTFGVLVRGGDFKTCKGDRKSPCPSLKIGIPSLFTWY